jgi:quercetin dioxygenase-like cupin family protein
MSAILHVATGEPARMQALGPYRIESLIAQGEEITATAYRVRIEAHQRTNISYHRVAEEIYFVLAGQGTAILNGQHYTVKAGDFLRLPPGTTHGFITGEQPLEMLDFHTPGCRPDHDVYFVDRVPEGFTERGADNP